MKLFLQARGSYETLLSLSKWSELNEIERIGLPDHYIVGKQRHDKNDGTPALDLLTAGAGLVRDTEKMVYSILVSPITFRHPSVLVKMASTINDMAKGRFRLGVGTGWLKIEHDLYGIPFPNLKTRFEMLEESLIYIREALSGNEKGFQGEYYQLEQFPVEPATLQDIPIIIGGGGKVKTPTLAGKYSEEFNIYAGPKETLVNSISLFKEVAVENGRDASTLEITTACPPVVGLTQERVGESVTAAAKALAQTKEEIVTTWKEKNYLYGTPNEVATTLSMWQEVGIEAVYLQLLSLQEDQRNETIDVIKQAVELL
ncbi:MAG: LLM class flavin-dependent oxidoreductase [Candidatus Actinomarina sp.]|tara:strand:+ start:312 stop:1256 length:945 start_codon:yes stop_codon:yes gene_type:complete